MMIMIIKEIPPLLTALGCRGQKATRSVKISLNGFMLCLDMVAFLCNGKRYIGGNVMMPCMYIGWPAGQFVIFKETKKEKEKSHISYISSYPFFLFLALLLMMMQKDLLS